jgi:hypothetical protein
MFLRFFRFFRTPEAENMGRYLELARRTIETLHARGQLAVASEGSSTQHSPDEINERNEESLSATSVRKAPQRPLMRVAVWAAGVTRLRAMPPPPNYPQHAWQQLLVDAEGFLDRWGTQAAALGWPDWELFGCHRQTPFGRINGMGLVLLLRGKELIALTDAEAAIRTATGAHQTYRRKPCDPLHPAERCLVWELT